MLNLGNIKLDRASETPLYMQLYSAIKEMIISGILLPGVRLPSVRKTSEGLGVNLVTAVSAYKKLENEGYLQSKPGSGTYVSDDVLFMTDAPLRYKNMDITGDSENSIIKNNPDGPAYNMAHNMAGITAGNIPDIPAGKSPSGAAGTIGGTYGSGIMHDESYLFEDIAFLSSHITITENTINFASATPSPNLFPVDDFKTAMNEVLDRDKGNAFSYQESQGFYPLRESTVEIIKRQGIGCTPEEIHVISGAQQGIDIISKALLRQGDGVITESPTYTGAIAVFRSRAARVIDVRMEKDGMNLGHLEYNLNKYKAKIIYTIPSYQNPTGNSYSQDKRLALLRLAEKYDCYIIEDDYVSDLKFEDMPCSPLKAMDSSNRVIFIKSFSKLFMPGLRLGFMIVPARLSHHLLEAKHTSDISTSGIIQRAFDLYIRKGFWDSHFKFMYNIYRERYEKMIESLENCMPEDVKWNKPGGGLNIWLNLPYGFPINNLVALAAANNIVFAPGRVFYSTAAPQTPDNIRLSFAAVNTQQIVEGIGTLCEIIKRILKESKTSTSMLIL